jgi:hypothetical protein
MGKLERGKQEVKKPVILGGKKHMEIKRSSGKKNALQISNGLWLAKARQYAVKHATSHGYVTSDDVLATIGVCQSPSVAGAIFKDSRFTKTGYTPSRRETTHGRDIAVWRLKK